jgi:hypothetical protein
MAFDEINCRIRQGYSDQKQGNITPYIVEFIIVR